VQRLKVLEAARRRVRGSRRWYANCSFPRSVGREGINGKGQRAIAQTRRGEVAGMAYGNVRQARSCPMRVRQRLGAGWRQRRLVPVCPADARQKS